MRAPVLPIYGCAGIMMLVVSKPFYDNLILVYIAGCIGATILEYVTGVLMETLFKVRYWDYSHKKFNYKGHICLESSLFWGIPTVVFTHFLQLPIEALLFKIPYRILSIVTIILTVVVSCDFMVAFKTAIDLRDILVYMEKAKDEMRRMQKRLDAIIAFRGEEVKEVRDGIGSKVAGISSGISSTVGGIGAGISSTVGGIGNGICSTVGGIGNGISSRIDVISSGLEKSFGILKERISINPTEYVGNVKEEVIELYTKYRILMDHVAPHPIRNFFDWYRNRTLLNNHLYSESFKQSLDELKERAASFRDERIGRNK